jgi:hypothetical protein
MHRRRGSTALLACLATLGVVASGCGASSHPNELRVPNTVNITTYITNKQVRLDPAKLGAGIASFTIANQSATDASLTLNGPVNAISDPIPAGGTGGLKVDLQSGNYQVTAGRRSPARPTLLSVGPERRSAQNDLLLP